MSRLYTLGTDIVSTLARDPQGSLVQRIEAVGAMAIRVGIVVAAELRFGCARKGSSRLTAQIDAILRCIPVLPFDAPAHAAALDVVLVTPNRREFERMQGLRVENWLDPVGTGP